MTVEEAKEAILDKFGTVSAFARAAGIERYELQKMFSRIALTEDEQVTLLTLIENTPTKVEGISPEKLELFRSKIQEAGGPNKFANEHPEFEKRGIFYTYEGKRKWIIGSTKRLFEHFKLIEDNENAGN